ncbi:MAG: shikimate dehydrogenase [Psychroserpens sp.]|nr:shikimate dehydrogenase [Psychroserpens sp.]
MARLGLLGKNIDYSFSKGYFTEKFTDLELQYTYENFDIPNIEVFPELLKQNPDISGLNVTIPYKESVIPYLGKLDKRAKKIGAVNTITFSKKGKLKGYNTDYYGFKKSIEPLIKQHHKRALILGTGGASKAVVFALKKLNVSYDYVSRTKKSDASYVYEDLTVELIKGFQIIINCTPIGTHPDVNACPDIPYDGITSDHLLYDLIYNPEETKFLRLGRSQGAQTCNGIKMLELQAEKAWKIWNSTF